VPLLLSYAVLVRVGYFVLCTNMEKKKIVGHPEVLVKEWGGGHGRVPLLLPAWNGLI